MDPGFAWKERRIPLMSSASPPGAPPCWSRQFDEGDSECNQCDYKTSCRAAFLRSNGISPAVQHASYAPSWRQAHQTPSVAPQVRLPTYQSRQPTIPPAPTSSYAPTTTYTTNFTQYYAPYEGETTFKRMAKHVVLKLLEVVFAELANFFKLWRWPPAANLITG